MRRTIVLALVAVAALVAGTVSFAKATGKVSATEKEFKITASPSSTSGGKTTFSVKNIGHLKHEFIVLQTNTPASKLKLKGSTAVLSGTVAGKITPFSPGQTKSLTVTLKPGHYILLCNLPAHYAAGQRLDFTVK
jgi:uncharacterized cupredoxin-like copper-binding protein